MNNPIKKVFKATHKAVTNVYKNTSTMFNTMVEDAKMVHDLRTKYDMYTKDDKLILVRKK